MLLVFAFSCLFSFVLLGHCFVGFVRFIGTCGFAWIGLCFGYMTDCGFVLSLEVVVWLYCLG